MLHSDSSQLKVNKNNEWAVWSNFKDHIFTQTPLCLCELCSAASFVPLAQQKINSWNAEDHFCIIFFFLFYRLSYLIQSNEGNDIVGEAPCGGAEAYHTLRGGLKGGANGWNLLLMSWIWDLQQWNGISLSAGGMSHTNYWPSLGLKLKSPTVQHDAGHV